MEQLINRMAAIEQLQSSTEFSTSLNHWEKSFVSFLQKEFKKVTSGILTIRMENRAIDLAQNKYGIPEIRAQQLIQKTAQEAQIGRIASEATRLFFSREVPRNPWENGGGRQGGRTHPQ